MKTQTYRVAIAGCGVAGLSTALFLKRAGHDPVIYDQMEAPRPIGSGLLLQPTGQAILADLGLLKSMRAYGQRIDQLLGKADGRTILDVRYNAVKGGLSGLAVHRAALFDVLYQAARQDGIPMEMGREIIGAESGKLIFTDRTSSSQYDFVINALGAMSPLKPKATKILRYGALWASLKWNPKDGFDPFRLDQRYKAARKMIGVLPVGTLPGDPNPKVTFFWSLKHEDYPAWRECGLNTWKQEVLSIWPETAPLLDQITSQDQLILAQYAHQTLTPPYDDRLVHIGDAYHCASPQLGQGANMALLDAYALVKSLEITKTLQAGFKQFHTLRRHHVRHYQWMAALFTPVYQSDGVIIPWLRDYLVPPLARIWPVPPLLAMIVAGLIGRPLDKLDVPISSLDETAKAD